MAEKRKFKLFDMNRDGPGVSKDEGPLVPNLKNMPKFYFRYFTKLLSMNFLMFPLLLLPLAVLYIYITAPTTPSQADIIYSTLYGSYLLTGAPVWASLLGVFGIQINIPVFNLPRLIGVAVLAVLLACIWGWINVGATYCARSMFRGEPVFLWSDFKYSIRRNLWPGFWMGVMDFVFLAVILYDFIYFSQIGGTFWLDFLFFAICGIALIYFFMRYYIYLMLITFDMKIRKILKNALIFSILGIGRNLMAVLGIAVIVGLNVLLGIALLPFNIVVPFILPLIYLLPTACLLKTYAAYPVIEKYMIRPVTDEE